MDLMFKRILFVLITCLRLNCKLKNIILFVISVTIIGTLIAIEFNLINASYLKIKILFNMEFQK